MKTDDYQQRIAELESLVEQLQSRNQYLEEQFKLAQQKQFGASSEGHPGQGELFNEAEELVDEAPVEKEAISYCV